MTSVYSNPLSPASGQHVKTVPDSHTVSRSSELLSCAKTAIKIAQRQNAGVASNPNAWWQDVSPSEMRLYDLQVAQPTNELLEDGLSLLRTMEAELKQLESLVRRRGHTNDPTEEISLSVKRLEADTKELSELIASLVPPTARGQRKRHWEILQQWFRSVAQQQGVRLKEILKVRGAVLAEQAQRRKRFQASSSANGSVARTAYDNPLFTMQAPLKAPVSVATANRSANGMTSNGTRFPASRSAPSSVSTSTAATRPRSSGYNYYNTSGGYAGVGRVGYGGSASNASYYAGSQASTTGMRQRKNVAAAATTTQQQQQQDPVQTQLLMRQQERQTQQRLQEARQAEKSLAEITTLFGKMSTLITQQSEVIDKVEDDVEAAMVDVNAGHQEITILYSIKKGNRALILKVFGLLIFFIIFMRMYR